MDQRMKNELDRYLTTPPEDRSPVRRCLTVGQLEERLKILKDKNLPIHILTKAGGEELEVYGIIFSDPEVDGCYYLAAEYAD